MKNQIADRESSPMRSLERALHILTILEEAGRSMSVTELANASLLSKATVLRILLVLEKYWFVEKRQGRYLLGVAVLPLAHEYVLGNELSRVALPVLRELSRTTKYTASLFVRFGFKRIAVQRVEGIHPLRFALPIGQRLPLHVGAGKVLTAGLEPAELEQLLAELEEESRARGEKFNRRALLEDIERTRAQGYHVSRGERMEGTFAVAAPVVADRKTIAAATVSGSADKLTPKKIDKLIIEVRDAAQAISERYGV